MAKTDKKKLKRIARFRARGLSFQEIASQLGVTKQAVHQMFHGIGRGIVRSTELRCSACKGVIPRRGKWLHEVRVLCLDCLDRKRTTFPQRLRSLRIAAGLSAKKLAARVGLNGSTVSEAERGTVELRPRTLAKLAAVLGPRLSAK
jgi:transcriptional regulator with XRE-family HTH domain